MKELSIEEKAKRYDKAIERAKRMFSEKELYFLFPELRESEDESIRKWIKKELENKYVEEGIVNNVLADKAFAWLEKQGEQKPYDQRKKCSDCQFNYAGECKGSCQMKKDEQKPADKVETKFKVGDWVVKGDTIAQILDIQEQYYVGLDINGKDFTSSRFLNDDKIHLWTINDAKTGDVLVCKGNIKYSNGVKYERICLFNNLDKAFFTLVKTSNYVETYDIDVNIDYPDNTVPATKEQREILFMAMANASYEWDAEKKELKKIEQKSTEWSLPYGKNETAEHLIALAECIEMEGDCLFNRLTGEDYGKLLRVLARELTQPKQEWSEEDIRNINDIDSVLFYDKDLPEDTCVRLRNWLESLRPQPKKEWSEEDERMYKSIIYSFDHNYPLLIQQQEFIKSFIFQNNITDEELAQAKKDAYNDALDKIEYHSGEPTFDDGWSAAIDYIRKKSLKPQNHWKPTEAQLASLTIACDRNDRVGFDLTQLLKELKKL